MNVDFLGKLLDAGFNKEEILAILENDKKQGTENKEPEDEKPEKQEEPKKEKSTMNIDIDELAKKIVGMIQQGNRTKDNSSNEEKKKSIDEILTSAIGTRKAGK